MSDWRPCPSCDGVRWRQSQRCKACANAARRTWSQIQQCSECGVAMMARPDKPRKTGRCLRCIRVLKVKKFTCSGCGGLTKNVTSKRCLSCHRAAIRTIDEAQHYVTGFNPAAFGELLERTGWTPRLIAERVPVNERTIQRWRTGVQMPKLFEWGLVANLLALELCSHCGGSGQVDPTTARIDALTRSVRRKVVALPTAQPLVVGAGWTLNPNTLRITVDATTLRITRQEATLISLLATTGGACLQADDLGQALGHGGNLVRTVTSRMRSNFRAAGLDFSRVIETIVGAGYRAVMPAAEEVAG